MKHPQFFSRKGQLLVRSSPDGRDQRLVLKGTNWFGLETSDFCLHGLWSVGMNFLLDFLATNKFNALRVPFSAELALALDSKVPGNCDYGTNPDLQGLSSAQMLDTLIARCAERGILVLLDLHRLKADKGIPELWYDDGDGYPEQLVLAAWKTMASRYKDFWNVFAAELNNEPHGRASWGSGNHETDWRLGAERLGKIVQEVNPRLLILVEGVENNVCSCPGESSWWGGHLGGCSDYPVRLPIAEKLVYSPHTYGPSVHMQPYFSDPAFPNNLPAIWQSNFGCVRERQLGPAVVHTEWGGRAEGIDEVWQKAFAAWLVQNDMADTFYWCLNPNSGDTGGLLLDDWKTPHAFKLQLLDAMVPQPTLFDAQGNIKDPGAVPTLSPFLASALPDPSAPPAHPTATTAAIQNPLINTPAAPATAPPATPPPLAPARANKTPAGPPAAAHLDLPPAQELTSGAVHAMVTAQDCWMEGSAQVVKYSCLVTNMGAVVASLMRLKVGGYAQLQQSWCCTVVMQEAGADGGFSATLGLPDWFAAGLPAGQSCDVGIIVALLPSKQPTFELAGN